MMGSKKVIYSVLLSYIFVKINEMQANYQNCTSSKGKKIPFGVCIPTDYNKIEAPANGSSHTGPE